MTLNSKNLLWIEWSEHFLRRINISANAWSALNCNYDTTSVCAGLSAGPCVCGFWMPASMLESLPSLAFCGANVAHFHFSVMFQQAWFSLAQIGYVGEMVLVYVGSFNIFFALLVILIYYVFIFITGLERHSSGIPEGHITPYSHLAAVSILYGAGITMYSQPSSSHSMDTDKIASVFYAQLIIPMLNPLVYSLSNKEVKSAFRGLRKRDCL